MHLYAHENRGQYPRTQFAPFSAPHFFDCDGSDLPFARHPNGEPLPGSPRDNDLTAGYFLLVHYKYVPVDVFVCPSTDHVKDPLRRAGSDSFRPRDPGLRSNFVQTVPIGKEFSYSFANPYVGVNVFGPLDNTVQYRTTDPADLALAADRNDGDRWRTLEPDSGRSVIEAMNSSNHRRKGQNVLFNDTSVVWNDTPFCGRSRDSIYTRAGDTSLKRSIPAGKHDSLLLPGFPLVNSLF
jgi:hypothetical protein